MAVTLPKLRQFRTEDARLLSTQLSRLEDNVASAIDQLGLTIPALPSAVVFLAITPTIQAPYVPGQMIVADTSAATIRIVLCAPTQSLAGKIIPLVKRTGANNLTITVAPPSGADKQGQINGSSSLNLGGAGPHYAICDGRDWWV